MPSPPGIGPNNNLNNIVQWTKPVKPSGSIDFYEVLVIQLKNEEVLGRRINIITGTSCTFNKFPTCMGAEYKTIVKVRAVNVVALADIRQKSKMSASENAENYNENDDLECSSKSEETFENIHKYMNDSLYELYKSRWQTTGIYSCSASGLSKITTIALVVVAMSLGVMAALYMARKKYNKMANINCTLPAGLETYFTKQTGAGFPSDFGNSSHLVAETRAAEDQWISAARMHDFNLRNEHHHLLASLGNDSGYLGGGNVGGGIESSVNYSGDILNEQTLGSSVEAAKFSEKSVPHEEDPANYEKKHFKESLQSTSTLADSLVESTEGSECNMDLDKPTLTIFPNNNGYIKQSMLQPWQTFNNQDEIPTNPPAASGYISVQSLGQALAKPNSSADFTPDSGGYVLQQDLQNFFNNKAATTNATEPNAMGTMPNVENIQQLNNGGYTTLENLTKFNLLPHNESRRHTPQQLNEVSNTHQPLIAANNEGGDGEQTTKPGAISGYVTQQDLNIFAQHQHNH